jgi:hypothetical protein
VINITVFGVGEQLDCLLEILLKIKNAEKKEKNFKHLSLSLSLS